MIPFPRGKPVLIPTIQHQFPIEEGIAKAEGEGWAEAVNIAFLHDVYVIETARSLLLKG
jgi:hypothetical protein